MRRSLWAAVIVLCAIGVAAAAARVIMDDVVSFLEPSREQYLHAFGLAEPQPLLRAREDAEFERRYAEHRAATLLHVVPGAFFLALAPLQFWAAFRDRHRKLHRWSGRLLVAAGAVTVPAALYFSFMQPFCGPAESVFIAFLAAWFFFSMTRGVVAARRRDIDTHRRWMIRLFATAVGIAVIRVIGMPIDVIVTPLGMRAAPALLLAMTSGWSMSAFAAELWIAYAGRASSASLQISTR